MKSVNIQYLNIIYPQNNIIINCNFDEKNFFIENIKIHKIKNKETNEIENYLCLGDNCNFCMENIKKNQNIYPIYEYFIIPLIVYPDSILNKNNKNKSKDNNNFINSILLLDNYNYNILLNQLNQLNIYGKLYINKIYKNILNYHLIKNNIMDLNNEKELNDYISNNNNFYFDFTNLFKKNDKIFRITFNNKKIKIELIEPLYFDELLNYYYYSKNDIINYLLRVFFKIKNYNDIKNNN